MKKLTSSAVLLLPPVDDMFFKKEKNKYKKKKIGYMGRLDYGKGADLAYNYFLNSKLNRNEFEFYIYSYPWKNDKFSIELHNKLKSQNNITYIETQLFDNPIEVDKFLEKIIDDTDIFFLPYRFMSSTIDAPLVPMELMARNTPFLSTNLQAIKDINYTENNLLKIEELKNIDLIDKIIKINLDNNIYQRAIKLGYKTSEVSEKFIKSLEKFNG
jgi:glycosyltransferase involved in cell wall biosynthesis